MQLLDLLWAYQQVDMGADRFEHEMRQAPNRQKLLRNRNFIIEQQNNMKAIEQDTLNKTDRKEAIEAEAARLKELVAQQIAAFEAESEEDNPREADQIEKQMAAVQKLLDSLTHYEQELTRLQRDADVLNQRQREIRVRAAKSKAEYDQIKAVYDVEFRDDTAKLNELRQTAQEAGEGIDKDLLERYLSIKQHSTPPMAMLLGDQCGGCYMNQPNVVLREVKAGEKVVCCDNCGRILYVPSEVQ